MLEVICGSMFSGKSEELIRRVVRAIIAKHRVAVYKPSIDMRYHSEHVVSHGGRRIEAISVNTDNPDAILETCGDVDVIAIDEVQFFSDRIIALIRNLTAQGKRVIVAGLDQDFRGEPFGSVPILMALAEKVDKLQAICVICGEPASRTQRIIDGKPARFNDEIIMVGADEKYEARCHKCHQVL